jgi:zinc protease
MKRWRLGFWILTTALLLALPARSGAVPVERFQLEPGVTLLVSRQRQIPMVFIVMVFPGGTLAEPAGKAGLADVTAELLQRGTKTHPGEQFATALDTIGAEMSVNADVDMMIVTLSVLTDHLDDALDLLAEVLSSPALAAKDFKKVRAEAKAAIKASDENPGTVARRAFLRALYGDHPYGHLVEGTEASLTSLTREDCAAYWKTVFAAKGAIITAAGDVKGKKLAGRIRKRLALWLARPGPGRRNPPEFPPDSTERRFIAIDRPFTQTTILMGQRGISRTDPAYYALEVFNYVLGGGGFSSRLLDEVRDNRGLAYGVSSDFDTRLLPGPFEIQLQTKNASAREALALVREVMNRSLEEGITAEEIDNAKAYLIGTYPRRYDTDAKMAQFLAATAFYGLGADYDQVYPEKIRGVTREAAMQAARGLLAPDRFVTVAVGRLDQAGLGEK